VAHCGLLKKVKTRGMRQKRTGRTKRSSSWERGSPGGSRSLVARTTPGVDGNAVKGMKRRRRQRRRMSVFQQARPGFRLLLLQLLLLLLLLLLLQL
jgi:hypothetical protein